MSWNPDHARKRVAELGKLLGPVLVPDCGGKDLAGEVFYVGLTVQEDRKIREIHRTKKDTANYLEMILRAKDKDGDRIWEEDELDSLLSGGVDPLDCAYIVGAMYAGDKLQPPKLKSGPFDKVAAAQSFEKNDRLFGPVEIPGIGPDSGPLDIYFRPPNGYGDCALTAIHRKYPDDADIRSLIARARTKDDKPMFKEEHLPRLLPAISRVDLNHVIISMPHPRMMSDELRIRMSVSVEANADPDQDDLKNL